MGLFDRLRGKKTKKTKKQPPRPSVSTGPAPSGDSYLTDPLNPLSPLWVGHDHSPSSYDSTPSYDPPSGDSSYDGGGSYDCGGSSDGGGGGCD